MQSRIDALTDMILDLEESIYIPVATLKAEGSVTAEPVPFSERLSGALKSYGVGDSWGILFDCAWFHLTGKVPEKAAGKHVVLLIDIGGEACIFDENGCPIRGLTNIKSQFDRRLGMPGKKVYQLTDKAKGGEAVDLWLEAGCNDLFGELQDQGKIQSLSIAVCNGDVRQHYYDMIVERSRLECQRQGFALDGRNGMTFSAIGHGHIDLAWLWPIRETRRKAARTFSTVLDLMSRYPEYRFGASQAQLYEWVSKDYPLLFDRIKQSINEGRWEVQGGMWVETDTNLPSGESLIRQLLYGQRYFAKTFGINPRILWLPDTFGYTAALPQIIEKSGMSGMMTIKLSWNAVNQFPHNSFIWKGLCGDGILVHMPPEGTYNSAALPESFEKATRQYKEKPLCNKALSVYGIGDGGGGPGAEHLERLRRQSGYVRQEFAEDFFEALSECKNALPDYKGELYLEKHQGTLTTAAKSKKYNRMIEDKIKQAEILSTMAAMKATLPYPSKQIESIWKEVLLYQFHDILPGSSIRRVYEESHERYEILLEQLEGIITATLKSMVTGDGQMLFNPLPYARRVLVEEGGVAYEIDLPPFGAVNRDLKKVVNSDFKSTDSSIENHKLRITFSVNGCITSIWDKQNQRECITRGSIANEFRLYNDKGDAWDFDPEYINDDHKNMSLIDVSTCIEVTRVVRKQVYSINSSTLVQNIFLEAGSGLVEFETCADWHEKDSMLRVDFPLAVDTDEVTCDIQFGQIARTMSNDTSIEKAQHEICAHKWMDVSEQDYGIILINDCKYGYRAKEGVISMNLIRCVAYPGDYIDEGSHYFRYALYPHKHHVSHTDVESVAACFNVLPIQVDGLVELPFLAMTEADNIILDTVKQAEEEDGFILRFFESRGKATSVRIKISDRFDRVYLTNLLEEQPKELVLDDDHCILIDFDCFEVQTLYVS